MVPLLAHVTKWNAQMVPMLFKRQEFAIAMPAQNASHSRARMQHMALLLTRVTHMHCAPHAGSAVGWHVHDPLLLQCCIK